MKKHRYGLIWCLACMFILNGCTNNEIKSGQQEQNLEDGTIQSENDKATEKLEEGFYRPGERIIWSDYYGQKVAYTVKDVRMANDLNKLEIETDKISDLGAMRIAEKNGKDSFFVAIDVDVTNESFKDYSNGKRTEDRYYFYIDACLKTETEVNDEDGISHIDDAIYFSLCSEEEKNYWKFYIEEGETVSATLVWLVSEKDLEEPLYYLIGSATGKETYQYCWLNEEMPE